MTTLTSLQKIIPPDQALANKALERSLRQVKNIFDSNLEVLAPVIEELESNYDLPLVQALETPLPTSVVDYYANTLATGTGPNGTLTLTDVIGTAAGATHNEELPIATQVLQDLDNDGQLDVLTANAGPTSSSSGVYTIMQYCLNGSYTSGVDPGPYSINIPGGVYGAGSYAGNTISEAMSNAFSTGLIPAAANVIAAVAAANSEMANIANQSFDAMANQLSIETTNSELAGIDYGNLQANATSVTLSFTLGLHDYGINTSEGGQAWYLEQVANTTNLYGQSVIASMREGRNIRRLNDAGIILDTQLPATPTADPQAELLPAQQSVAEATDFAQNNQ